MLTGLTGKQNLDLEEQATEQIIGRDGTVTGKVNGRKLVALMVGACLRARGTGERVFNDVDVLGESGDGNGALLDLDSEVFKPLIQEIYAFVGRRPAADIKKNLPPTNSANGTSSLPPVSDEPSVNSSTESTLQNSPSGLSS